MTRLDGLLISSGFSSRMGDFKPLLNYQGIPFVIQILIKLCSICENVTIVLGHKAEEIEKVLDYYQNDPKLIEPYLKDIVLKEKENVFDKLIIIENKDYKVGMFTSLQTGLKNVRNNFTIYHFVDQPHIPMAFYNKISKQKSLNYDWLQPTFREKKGHPIIFNKKVKDLILKASPENNLRSVLKDENIKRNFWECDFPQILDDINTPKDYKGLC